MSNPESKRRQHAGSPSQQPAVVHGEAFPRKRVLAYLVCIVMTACGGGDYEPEPDPPDVNCNVIPRPEACL